MSRAICPKCGNVDVNWIRDDDDYAYYVCLECKQGFCYPPKSLFDHLISSPDVLAEKFIFKEWHPISRCYVWYSLLFNSEERLIYAPAFATKEEAYAATVARLKEVEK